MIWVIGCNGMLGKEVCKQLTEKNLKFVGSGHEVDILKIENLESFLNKTETSNYISSHRDVNKDPDNGRIKWIINCSAYTAVDKAEDEQELCEAINSQGVLNIARVCKNHGIKLIHISTDFVFDGTKATPYTEKDQKNPISTYGKTKSAGEDQIISSMSQYYILRTSWLYGFNGKNFVYTMVKLMNSRSNLNVVCDQKGTPTFAPDLADSIIKIIEKTYKANGFFGSNSIPSYGIYNFSNEGSISWFDFAKKIYELGRKYNRITQECDVNSCTTSEYPTKAVRPAYSVLDKTKIQKELKIKISEWDKSLELFIKNKNFEVL